MTNYDEFYRKRPSLTEDEFERMADIMAERLRNVAYTTADRWLRKALNELHIAPGIPFPMRPEGDAITIQFSIQFVRNDLNEIVGGFRRQTGDNDERYDQKND